MAMKDVKRTNGANCDEEGGNSISEIEDKGFYDGKNREKLE